jgi:divinyl chlorophyllide a 8-vinyl-reductase
VQLQQLNGAEVRFGDVSSMQSLAETAFSDPVDVVVSCLASRTGGKVCVQYKLPQRFTQLLLQMCRPADGAVHIRQRSSACYVSLTTIGNKLRMSGLQQDSWDIDYQATLNALEAGKAAGARHFVLLSAICVQKPLLEFQKAKLKFEAALQVCFSVCLSFCKIRLSATGQQLYFSLAH